MAVKGYDNIYDFSSPEEMQKPGDVVLQPVEDSVNQIPTFNTAPQYINLPSEKQKYQNWRDPETEAQLPSLNLDHSTPNQAPRTAYLDDQNPDHVDDPDRVDEFNKYPSTHQTQQVQTLPDPYIEVMARSIVAEYNLQHSPIELDLDSNVKVAWTLPELVRATSALSKKYEPNCEASFKKVRSKINRYDFHVKCAESWSDPSGHIVKIKFVPVDQRITKAANAPIIASCSCNFWKYYGADYNSMQGDYNERQMGNGAAPTVRGKNHMICKHLASCVPLIKYVMLKR